MQKPRSADGGAGYASCAGFSAMIPDFPSHLRRQSGFASLILMGETD